MTDAEIRTVVGEELVRIAPEIDVAQLASAVALRDQVDLDSMDWLNLLVALHRRLRVDIPEADYAKLVTLDALVAYLQARLS
jgi:acyl carrier protein